MRQPKTKKFWCFESSFTLSVLYTGSKSNPMWSEIKKSIN